MFFYPFNYINPRNTQAVANAAEKLKQRNLPIEQILDEEELMNDLKYANTSHLNKDDMIDFLKYVIREPERDELKIAYKYPFNASEILSSENTYLLDKFFDYSNALEDKFEDLNEADNKAKMEDEENGDSEILQEQNEKRNEDVNMEDLMEEAIAVHSINEDIRNVEQKLEVLNLKGEVGQVSEENKLDEGLLTAEEQKKELSSNIEQNTNVTDSEEIKAELYVEGLPSPQNKENTEVETKTEKQYVPKYEVFDYLLTFLDDDNPLNYVLGGYFAKIFNILKYNRPAAVTRYLYFFKKDSLYRMIYHINRKAISDTLLKFLLMEASEIASDISVEYENNFKYELVEKVIDSFDQIDEEKCNNICDLLSEALNNRKFAIMIIKNPQIVNKLKSLVLNNINSEYFKELLKISTKLCDFIQKEIRIKINKNMGVTDSGQINTLEALEKGFGSTEFEEMIPGKTVENYDLNECPYLLEILFDQIKPVVMDYVDKKERTSELKIHTTYDKTVQILGTRRLLEFEYIKLVYEIFALSLEHEIFDNENSNTLEVYSNFISLLIDHKFFPQAIDDFFTHEWNNSFQSQFEGLMTLIINSYDSDNLIEHIFIHGNFLDRIIDSKFINNGYLPFVIEISNHITNSKNEVLASFILRNKKWSHFFNNFVEPVRKRFATGLMYDPVHEANLFKEETKSELSEPTTQQIELSVIETTEKNFIESVRKQANASRSFEIESVILSSSNFTNIENSENQSQLTSNQIFYDNNYWIPIIPQYNQQETDDILAEII